MKAGDLWVLASRFKLLAVGGVPKAALRVRGMFFGWYMAGLGAVLMALASAPIWHGLPVWSPVLRNAFDWTTVQMSWAFAVTRVEGGLLGPLEGLLVQRLGTRRVVFIGLTVLGTGLVLFSRIEELWQLYAAFFIMSLGAALSTWLPMMTLTNHWFVRHKARAMSIVFEGFAIGGIAVPLLLAWAIGGADPEISERYGWRNTALFLGVLTIALAFPLTRMIRNRPEDMGLRPDGDLPNQPATVAVTGRAPLAAPEAGRHTWKEAFRTKPFWIISLGHASSSIVSVTIFVHMGLMLDDRGFSLQTIGAAVAVYTAANALLIPVGGYLGDRLPIRFMAFGSTAVLASSVVVLVVAQDAKTLFLFGALFGIASGVRSPVTTALRGHYFGREAFAVISGLSMAPMNIFLFVAPLAAGFMRDAIGDYTAAFLTIAGISLAGSFLFLMLGEPPGRPTRTAARS